MQNCVSINLKKDEIVMKISENADHKEVMSCLKKKIPELKKLYKDDKTPIYIIGKILKNKEMEDIQEAIRKQIDVTLNFDTPKTLGLHGIRKTYNKEIETSETKFYKGSLRSGQELEFEGSLVVLGDVNAGAEIRAGGNIVVLGILRGLAHAGAKGNKKAIVSAASIEAAQLRIANVVKEMEIQEETIQRYTYVYLENDEMILE